VLLPRSTVDALNAAVRAGAEAKLCTLRLCSTARATIHSAQWELQRCDLERRHKTEHVRDLQLLHVTRNVGDVLEGRAGGARHPDERRLEARLDRERQAQVRLCVHAQRRDGGR